MTQRFASVMFSLPLLLNPMCFVLTSFAEEAAHPATESAPAAIESSHTTTEEAIADGTKSREENDADGLVNLLSDLRGAVRAFPDSVEDRLDLADALYRVGDLDQAIDEAGAAVALKSDSAAAHLQLGLLYMAKQDWKHALLELKEATRLNPELIQGHYHLGAVYYGLGNVPAAIQSYQTALDLQPDFPDARYHLGLLLKLTHRDKEAATLLEAAAEGGVARAQLFMANAYRTGQGVEKDLARAIFWWLRAAENGIVQARESLARLRRQALSPDQPDRRRKEALEAFTQYRDGLWADYPDAVKNSPDESLGAVLLKNSQATNGVSVLFSEAYTLSETATDELARRYAGGLDSRLKQFDRRILACLEATAADGFAPAKKALARIYGKGLGVPADLAKAKALLKGLPKQEAKAILDEITVH